MKELPAAGGWGLLGWGPQRGELSVQTAELILGAGWGWGGRAGGCCSTAPQGCLALAVS